MVEMVEKPKVLENKKKEEEPEHVKVNSVDADGIEWK